RGGPAEEEAGAGRATSWVAPAAEVGFPRPRSTTPLRPPTARWWGRPASRVRRRPTIRTTWDRVDTETARALAIHWPITEEEGEARCQVCRIGRSPTRPTSRSGS